MTAAFIRNPTLFEASERCPFGRAFGQLLPELGALAEPELQVVNIDVPKAVTMSFAVVERLTELARSPGVAPELEPYLLERLTLTTRALAHTHRQLVGSLEAASPQLIAKARDLKQKMEAEVSALTARGAVLKPGIQRPCGRPGLRTLAAELAGLAETLRRAKASGHRTSRELRAAEAYASRLLRISRRPMRQVRPNDFPIHRGTFTLFCHAYGSVRQAVAHLRDAELNVDILVPTLYGPRPGARRSRWPRG